jgi:hypothetical protein
MRADINQRTGAMQQAVEIFLIHDEFFPFNAPLRLSSRKTVPKSAVMERKSSADASLSAYLYLSALRLQCADAG